MLTTRQRSPVLFAAFSLLLFLITASTFSSRGVVPHMVEEQTWNWASAGLGFTRPGACCGASSFLPAFLIRKAGVRLTILMGSIVMVGGFWRLAQTQSPIVYCPVNNHPVVRTHPVTKRKGQLVKASYTTWPRLRPTRATRSSSSSSSTAANLNSRVRF